MLAGLLILAFSTTVTFAEEEDDGDDGATGIPEGVNCGDGLLIPIWRPYDNLSGGDRYGQSLSIQANSVERQELLPVFTGPFGRAITHLILIFYFLPAGLASAANLAQIRII